MVKQSTNEMNVFETPTKLNGENKPGCFPFFLEEFGAGRDDGEEWWVWYKVTHRNLM